MRGRKTKLLIGDRWEYYSYAKEMNLPLDLDYYMEGGIIGQFAQFMAYLPQFYVAPQTDAIDAESVAEKKTLLASKKYVSMVCTSLSCDNVCQGPILKKLYSIASKKYKEVVQLTTDTGTRPIEFRYDSNTSVYQYFKESIEKESKDSARCFAQIYVKHMRKKYGAKIVYVLMKVFANGANPLLRRRTLKAQQTESRMRQVLHENDSKFDALFKCRDHVITQSIEKMKHILKIDDKLWDGEMDVKTLDDTICTSDDIYVDQINQQKETRQLLHDTYDTLVCASVYVEQTKAIVEYLEFYISKHSLENPLPPGVDIEINYRDATNYIKKNLIDF
jgi:hypothetical protein